MCLSTFWAGAEPWQWRTQGRSLTIYLLHLFAQGEHCWRPQLGEQGIQEEQTKDKWQQKRLPKTSTIQKNRQQNSVSIINFFLNSVGRSWFGNRKQEAGRLQGAEGKSVAVGVWNWALESDTPNIKSLRCHNLTQWAHSGHVIFLSLYFLICKIGIIPTAKVAVRV